MKAAYIIFARDKAHVAPYVERCVRSAFAQVGPPIEILVSDQGSTDGTRELLAGLVAQYAGPHRVRLLDCPDTALGNMAGLNAHVAWLHDQTDAEIFIPSAADDYTEPERSAVLLEAFEATGADMVGSAMYFEDPNGGGPKSRSAYAREGWVDMRGMAELKVGGSSGGAWRRSFWDRIQPIPVLCGFDVYMPPLACLLGGFWYVNKPLHTYVTHADARNTGIEGAIRALPEHQRLPLDELRFFQTGASWQWVMRRMASLRVGSHDDQFVVERAILAHAAAQTEARTEMTLRRQAPASLPI